MSERNKSPKTMASIPSPRALWRWARIADSYSGFGQGQGIGTFHRGRPTAAACASTSPLRTSCMATRSPARVVSSPATSRSWRRARCNAQAASLPPLQATTAFICTPPFASAHHGDGQLAVARAVELAEVDRLPGAEQQLPALHRDRLGRTDQLGVRVRVPLLVLVVFPLLR